MSRQTPRRSGARTRSKISARCSKRWPRHEPWPAVTSSSGITASPRVRSSTPSRLSASAARPAVSPRAHVGAGMEDEVGDAERVAALHLGQEAVAAARRGSPRHRAGQVDEVRAVRHHATRTPLLASASRKAPHSVVAQRPAAPLQLVAREDLDGLRADGRAVRRARCTGRRRWARGRRVHGCLTSARGRRRGPPRGRTGPSSCRRWSSSVWCAARDSTAARGPSRTHALEPAGLAGPCPASPRAPLPRCRRRGRPWPSRAPRRCTRLTTSNGGPSTSTGTRCAPSTTNAPPSSKTRWAFR